MFIEWAAFVVFLFYFIIYQSIWAVVKFKQIKVGLLQGTENKLKFYSDTMISLWIAAFLVILLTLFTVLSCGDIGISGIELHSKKWLTYLILILISTYSCYLIYQTSVLRICAIKKKKVKIKLSDEVASFLPDTNKEKWIYVFMCVTAGITEEILFRGYLMHTIGILFPGLNLGLILCISAGIFGIAHLYQGKKSIITTGLIGLVYGIVYLALGSIVPVMFFHFLQDLSAVDYKTVRSH